MMMVFMCTLYCWRDEFGELAAFAIWGLCHVIATGATLDALLAAMSADDRAHSFVEYIPGPNDERFEEAF